MVAGVNNRLAKLEGELEGARGRVIAALNDWLDTQPRELMVSFWRYSERPPELRDAWALELCGGRFEPDATDRANFVMLFQRLPDWLRGELEQLFPNDPFWREVNDVSI